MPRKGYGRNKSLREQHGIRMHEEWLNQQAGQVLPAQPDSDDASENKNGEPLVKQEKGGEVVEELTKKVETLEKKVEMLEGNNGKLQQMVASLEMRVKMLEQQAQTANQPARKADKFNKRFEALSVEDEGGIVLESKDMMETF